MVWLSGSAAGTLEIRDCVIEHAYSLAIFNNASEADVWVHGSTIRNSAQGVAGNRATVENNTLSNLSTATSISETSTILGNTIVGGDMGRVLDGDGAFDGPQQRDQQ